MTIGTAQQPTPLDPSTSRFGSQPALDGIRAGAVAAVFGLHAATQRFPGGFVGVDIFFTLSAFLITTLVLEETVSRGGRYGFRAFYWRRALRLGPALLIWLVLLAGPTSVLLGEKGQILKSSALVLTYVTNLSFISGLGVFSGLGGAYGHGWSLAVEEQFYLVWPLLLVLMSRRWQPVTRRRVLVLALPFTILAQILLGAALTPNQNYFLPSGHLLPLLAGCLAADLRMYGAPRWITELSTRSAPAILVGIGLFAVVLGYNVVPRGGLLVPTTTFAGLGTALVILHVCARSDSPGSRLLSSRPLRWVGQRSYGYYLYSLTILEAVPRIFPGIQIRYGAPLTLVVSTVLVAASYRWVEKPLLRHKHRFDAVRPRLVTDDDVRRARRPYRNADQGFRPARSGSQRDDVVTVQG
jgi:peptidoglycan/LPS O-acetylase OafA/YrhL